MDGGEEVTVKEENEYYEDCSFVSVDYIICECGETFPSENGLRTHLEKEHPHKRERKEFKCGVCGAIFSSEDDCVSHYEDTHFENNVNEEPEVSDEVDEVYDADEVDEPDEEPSVEVKTELVEEAQPVEEAEEPEDDLEGQLVHLPEGLGQVVRDTSGQLVLLVTTLANKPPQQRKRRQQRSQQPNKPKKKYLKANMCEVCGRSYASNAALTYHQRTHTGERPFKCHLCPKAFTMPLFLQVHIRTHTGERPYQCPECPKAFSNRAALLRHDRVHTGVKPYQCPMCLKSFTQSNSMKLHVATVHLKQPAPYKSKSRKMRDLQRRIAPKGKDPLVTLQSVSIKMDEDGEYQVIESEIIDENTEQNSDIEYRDS